MSKDDKSEPSPLMSIEAIVETLGPDQVYAWTGKHDEDAFFVPIATRLIREGLQQLFEGKHLYQSIDIADFSDVQAAVQLTVANPKPQMAPTLGKPISATRALPQEQILAHTLQRFTRTLNRPWKRVLQGAVDPGWLGLQEPKPVRLQCPTCDARVAFNPVPANDLALQWEGKIQQTIQHFVFAYECQQCRRPAQERIVFTVVRRGTKITLFGRDPIEAAEVEKYIPKSQVRFYSGAIIARNAGQPLAGLFMLRTFIEQFWRAVPGVEQARTSALTTGKRLTGDELNSEYSIPLPDGLKSSFPSLGTVYADLSEAIHDAKEGDKAVAAFNKALDDINKHFDARRLFGII